MPEWTALKESGLYDCLSEGGREQFLPPGIFHWSGRAKREADINATIGSAFGPASEIGEEGAGTVFFLPTLAGAFADLKPDQVFSYAPILGVPAFRQAWRSWVLEKVEPSGRDLEPLMSSPAVTAGITGGITVAAGLFLTPGESIILPDRYWGNYNNILVRNIGARITTFPFYDGDDFNVTGLKAAVEESLSSQGKAVVLLNFPNNPTGFSPPPATARRIACALEEAAVESGKWVVAMCDDAYEGFTYTRDCLQYSIFAEIAGKRNVLAVKLDGVSKEFLWYGGRVGCITFAVPEDMAARRDLVAGELEEKAGAAIRSSISNCNHPVQEIIAAGLRDRLGALLAERQRVIDVLAARWTAYNREMEKADLSVLKPLASNSGFFALVDLVSAKAEEVADLLMTRYRVGVVPITSGGKQSLRIAFCSVPEGDIPRLVDSVFKAAAEAGGE